MLDFGSYTGEKTDRRRKHCYEKTYGNNGTGTYTCRAGSDKVIIRNIRSLQNEESKTTPGSLIYHFRGHFFDAIYFLFLFTSIIFSARTFDGRPNRVMKPWAS